NTLIDLAEFLERQAQREIVAAHAAVFLRERQAEQAHVGHPRHHLVRERMLLVMYCRDRGHHTLGEVAHGLRELFVVIRQHFGSQKIAHDSSSFVLASAESPARPAVILASGWPTLTWSPTATSSSTTPSTGAVSACSIFMASTVITAAPAVTDDPSAWPTATTEPGMGLASSASPLCSSSGRTGASRTSSVAVVRPLPDSQTTPSAAAATYSVRSPS